MTLDRHKAFLKELTGKAITEVDAYRLYSHYSELVSMVDAAPELIPVVGRKPHPLYPEDTL
jgi:hypothetical protein